ncbi:hypothetical protein [Actinoallomurus iriomotensis]
MCEGEIFSVVGLSGCGKTTLLRIVGVCCRRRRHPPGGRRGEGAGSG